MEGSGKRRRAPNGWLGATIRIAAFGGLVAVMVLAWLPPDLPTSPGAVGGVPADRLMSELLQARANAEPGVLTQIPWTLVNGSISDRVESAVIEGLRIVPVSLVRCYIVALDENRCEVVMERKIFDFAIFSRVQVAVEKGPDGYSLKMETGSIGRLPLPGAVVLKLSPGLAELTGPFASELAILSESKSIQLSPDALAVGF